MFDPKPFKRDWGVRASLTFRGNLTTHKSPRYAEREEAGVFGGLGASEQ